MNKLKVVKNLIRGEKGITLIALVITVIVILILSGIALSMLSGENSVLRRATQAKKVTGEAEFKEQLQLEVMASYDTFGNLDKDTLEANIRKDISGVTVSSGGDNENDLLTASLNGMNYSIDSDGNVTKAEAKPVTSGLTITQENGDAIPSGGVEAGTNLKINFSASIEGGTVTISPTVPHTTTTAEANAKKVVFTLTGTVDGETVTTTYTVDLKSSYKSNEVSQQELQKDANKYFGWDVLNYAETLPTNYQNTEWQLFYSGKIDDEDSTEADHIYLISKDYVPYSLLPAKNSALPLPTGNTDYKTGFSNYNSGNPNDGVVPQYAGSGAIGTIGQKLNSKFYSYLTTNSTTSTYNNIKAVAYMLDTPIWENFASSYADYAIGGPSVELLFKAYNKYKNLTGSSEYKTDVNSLNGYRISKDGGTNWASYYSGMIVADTSTVNSPYIVSSSTNASGFWLASPSAYDNGRVLAVRYDGYVNDYYCAFYYTYYGFRPIVCLKSNYTLEKTKDSNNHDAFNIVEKSE